MSAEHPAACVHDWRWLDRPVFVFQPIGLPMDAYNAECTRCGERCWAHGTMPNAKPITVTLTPTTGRS